MTTLCTFMSNWGSALFSPGSGIAAGGSAYVNATNAFFQGAGVMSPMTRAIVQFRNLEAGAIGAATGGNAGGIINAAIGTAVASRGRSRSEASTRATSTCRSLPAQATAPS